MVYTTYNSQCVLNVQINFLKTKVIIISLIIICSICYRQGQGKLVFGLGKVWEISEIFFLHPIFWAMYLIYFFAVYGSVKPGEQTGSVLHRLMMEQIDDGTFPYINP